MRTNLLVAAMLIGALAASARSLEITDPTTSLRFCTQEIDVRGNDNISPDDPPGIQVKGFARVDELWYEDDTAYADWDTWDAEGFGLYAWFLPPSDQLQTNQHIGDYKVVARHWINGGPGGASDSVEFQFSSRP